MLEARAALSLRLTMSQWDELDEYDRAFAMAPLIEDARRESERCPACGGPKSECQDVLNQHAFEAEEKRCYRTAAVNAMQRKRERDHDGVMTTATFNPALRKPPKE